MTKGGPDKPMGGRGRGTDKPRQGEMPSVNVSVCVQQAKSEYTLTEGIQKHKLLKNKT